jgi:hypothetical protein
MGRLKREDRALLQAKKMKKKKKKNQTKAKAIDPEQKVGWTWTNLEGRTAGHTTRWFRQGMID